MGRQGVEERRQFERGNDEDSYHEEGQVDDTHDNFITG